MLHLQISWKKNYGASAFKLGYGSKLLSFLILTNLGA